MNDPGLKRTVFITGATSGIGSAVALKFAAEGWNIILHFNSSGPQFGELKRKLSGLNTQFQFLKADFSSRSQLRTLSAKLDTLRIDSVVNNAGTCMVSKHFSELTLKDMNDTFMVNSFAPMLLTSRIFMLMKERRFGRIVNISSIAAKYGGSSFSMHYGCSKRALEGLTRTLAREGAECNVLVNTIRPGVIDTAFHRKFPKDLTKRIAMIPLRKMGVPGDIADIAYYLGSDKNSFITNETIAISGGE
ncbi:MAG: SDR family oxidoreductase [Nitrospirae bacterium]|nr:SDR family oxidoreductase [Nitrospirota bacterium]